MRLASGVPRTAHIGQTRTMAVERRMVLELATAQELETGIARAVALVRRACAAVRVEWWTPDDEGEMRLVASDGAGAGQSRRFSLGAAGEVVVVGCCDPRLAVALARVAPIVRRRCAEERLARATMKLARRNEALEEFAALVAHELKTPLQAALVADDASSEVERALELVDSLLEAAHEARNGRSAPVGACLEQALQDLGATEIEVTARVAADLPLPPAPLRIILRNLLRNAVAAGARRVQVVAVRSAGSSRLLVIDDGVGLHAVGGYEAGSGLGLSLCRRIAGRYGAELDVAPGPAGGTWATLRLTEAS
jgi:signal transduction histidine kinase